MRRDAKIVLATLGFAGLWAGGSRAPEAMASMETFRVTDVQIRGLRYLLRSEAMALLAVDAQTSVWTDIEAHAHARLVPPVHGFDRVRLRLPRVRPGLRHRSRLLHRDRFRAMR